MGEKIKFEPQYKSVLLNDNLKKYSPINRSVYDKERHIPLEESFKLIESQNDEFLSRNKLEDAIANNEVTVYWIEGQKYLDRLDIGRVYHKEPEKREGLTLERYFTTPDKDPFNSVKCKKMDLKIEDFDTKKVIFELKDAEMPEWIDEVSAKIVAQKYFFKPAKKEWKEKLNEKIGSEYEYSLKHLNKRVADFFADEGWKLGYFKTEKDRENFRDELAFLQINGAGAFNSPIQFNSGLFNSYGIEGSLGINYWKDPKTGEVKKVLNGEYIHPQLHACFIKGLNDDLGSIAQNVIDEIAIFASGSGIGHDIGKLRGEGEELSGGGKASGSMSFFKIYDKVAGTIKSGGKTRRAARMTTMRYTHPDIMEFIRTKVQEDKKALILMQNGFSPGMDGEAYTTVAYQNTNLTVRLDDEFFETLKKGGEIQTYKVNNGKLNQKISADRILKEIAFGSWRIGDPAVQYESKIQEMNTSKNSGRQNSTNPCSEYLFLDDTSCSLFSLRNTYFLKEDGNFDVDKFKRAMKTFTIAQNIANEAASYPVKEIAQISTEFMTVGGGYADLGSLLMRKGIPYDSSKGRAITGAITALMTGTVYETSAELAKTIGTFTHYEFNKKQMLEVISKHKKNLDDILWEEVGDEKLKSASYKSWENVLFEGEKHGFRNAQATVLAPTGTISYLMGCSTQGIEPAMSLSIVKNLAGGGKVIIANKDIEIALNTLGYNQDQIEDISEFIGKNNTMRNAPHVKPEHYSVFDTAFGNAKGEGSIEFEGHVRMVGAAQPFISGAISKTNNLPKNATVKEIYDAYLLGHELGLKAISIFRNDSKPISAIDFGGKTYKKLKRGEKEDLPTRRNAFEWEVNIGGTPFHILTSEYNDGRPGQITFLSYKAGSTLGAILTTTGISASKSLKRGLHLEDAIAGWEGQRFEPNGIVHGHPYIKIASSPLDFAYKLLKLEYLGDIEMAEHELQKEVKLKDLRGFHNSAFRTYQRMNFDEWNIEDVLKDPETGGFTNNKNEPDNSLAELIYVTDKTLTKAKKRESIISFSSGNSNGHENEKKGLRGKTCNTCGNIMNQTSSNCFECKNCGDKVGGCGA